VTHQYLSERVPFGIAHRGGSPSKLAEGVPVPENTQAAFAAARTAGYRYLETDVHLSADGQVVVSHDPDLGRVGGADITIASSTWDQLSKIELDGGHRLSLLRDLLEAFPDAFWNIDPKSDDVVGPLIALIRDAKVLDRVCFGSFRDRRLAEISTVFGSDVCLSAGPRGTLASVIAAFVWPFYKPRHQCLQLPAKAYGLPLNRSLLIRRLQRLGLQVHYWTINTRSDIERLLDAGADAIITDEIYLLRQILQERNEWE